MKPKFQINDPVFFRSYTTPEGDNINYFGTVVNIREMDGLSHGDPYYSYTLKRTDGRILNGYEEEVLEHSEYKVLRKPSTAKYWNDVFCSPDYDEALAYFLMELSEGREAKNIDFQMCLGDEPLMGTVAVQKTLPSMSPVQQGLPLAADH